MINAYLTSAAIYMIIILCESYLLESSIVANGWCDDVQQPGKSRLSLIIAISMIPVVRLGVVLMSFYMAVRTKKDFEKWKDSLNK